MNLNKFTQKAQEAVLAAQHLAEEQHHSQIQPLHLLAALLGQAEGVVPQLVNKIGANLPALHQQTQHALQQLPQAYGGSIEVWPVAT